MMMHDFLAGMIALVIPSFFVCVLFAVLMYRKWDQTTEE